MCTCLCVTLRSRACTCVSLCRSDCLYICLCLYFCPSVVTNMLVVTEFSSLFVLKQTCFLLLTASKTNVHFLHFIEFLEHLSFNLIAYTVLFLFQGVTVCDSE